MRQNSDSSPDASDGERLHYLDWLRVLAVVAAFVGHVSLPFSGGRWVINGEDIILVAGLIIILGNQFVIPILFLVSGAAAYFSLQDRPTGQFLRERVSRLAVPYLVGVAIFSPLQAYLQAANQGWYEGDLLSYLPQFLDPHRFSTLDLSWVGGYGYHLWYLGFLFVFSVAALPLFRYLQRAVGRQIVAKLAALVQLRGGILLFAIPIAQANVVLRLYFSNYQGWADFVFWLAFFIYGYILFSNPQFQIAIRRDRFWIFLAMLLSLLAIFLLGFATLFSLRRIFDIEEVPMLRGFPLVYVLVVGLISLNSWASVLFIVAIAMHRLNRGGQWLAHASQAALPFYLLHHPMVVILAFFIVRTGLSAGAQYALLLTSAFIITMALYSLVIWPNNLLRRLLGLRPLRRAERAALGRRLHVRRLGFAATLVLFSAILHAEILRAGKPIAVAVPVRERPPPGWVAVRTGEETACVDGDPYQFFVRFSQPGQRSDRLMLYFQAGGMCWNALTCSEDTLLLDRTVDQREMADYAGLFDFANPQNPVLDYDIVFIPHCTGDGHTGAATVTYTDFIGNTITIEHRGHANATTALDWVYRQYTAPRQVFIVGSSTGAIGGIFHAASVMNQYPSARIVQLADGYVGVMPSGWDGVDRWRSLDNLPEPTRQQLTADWPARFVTDLYLSTAQQFAENAFAQFTTAADALQIGYFNLAGGNILDWPNLMNSRLVELEQSLDNFSAFVAPGLGHAVLTVEDFYTLEVGGVRVRDWLAALLAGGPATSVRCDRGTLDCP